MMTNSKPYRRTCRLARYLPAFVALLAAIAPSLLRADVIVDVSHVGLPSSQGRDIVRSGAWVPVVVDVSLDAQNAFNGTLRVTQTDNSGDRCYDSVEVHLLQSTGGMQRYYLYVPANTVYNQTSFEVELLDSDGEVVEVVSAGELTIRAKPPAPPMGISDDDVYILSVSTSAIGRISGLTETGRERVLARTIYLGHLNPMDLPEHWIGLDVADYIVWEDADPDDLTPSQLQALIEWVKQGGTLLVAAAQTAGAIAQSDPLSEILPVKLGEVFKTPPLRELRRSMLGFADEDQELSLAGEVTMVRATRRSGAIAVHEERVKRSDDETAEPINQHLISHWPVGRGRVIFCAMTLRDVFEDGGSARDFFRRLFYFKLQSGAAFPNKRSVFNNVVASTLFSTSSSLYLMIAVLFSVAYVAIATFGSWAVLKSRGLRHHNWSAFSLVAIAASFISVIMVRTVQGIETKLHQVTIVDANAGETFGYATTFFGVKTASDSVLDLWLPSDHLMQSAPDKSRCYLKPTPVGFESTQPLTFTDPSAYRLVPASAVVENVRIRSTLKRMMGRWEGPIRGTLRAQVSTYRDGRNVFITDESYVINDLGVDLENCYLLQAGRDSYALGQSDVFDVRDNQMFAFFLGDLPADGSRVSLAQRCYASNQTIEKAKVLEEKELRGRQGDWSRHFLSTFGFGGGSATAADLGREQEALLMLSTIGDFEPDQHGNARQMQWGGLQTISRDRLRHLDLKEQLQTNCVYLVGFAQDPGPVRLKSRRGDRAYKTMEPDERTSWTMYRIRIPITARVAQRKAPGNTDAPAPEKPDGGR